jgi:hypothetical protein
LPRTWKLDSRFHRYAIGKLFPDPLAFPEARAGRRVAHTAPKPQAFYWALRQRHEILHFFDQTIYDDTRLFEFIEPHLNALSDILDPTLLKSPTRSPRQRQRFFHLAAIALWRGDLVKRSENR